MNLKSGSFLIIVLFLTSILHASDPVVEVVASLTKSGGIYGDGEFNVIGDKVNGREICSQDNNNSNIEPGCDMLQDTGYNNNNTQDPTDDYYTGDLIVRTSDIFELKVGWSIVYSDSPVTITSTLPVEGFRWEALPSRCNDSSSISDDGLTMTCVLSISDENGGAGDLPFNIKVKASTKNGTKTGLIPVTISSDGAESKTDDPNGELTVTAAPKWNIQKSLITYTNYTNDDNVSGYKITYGFYLEADEVSGEEDSSSAVLGNEALGEDFALHFTDTFTNLSDEKIPNSELIGCRIGTISGQPYPFYNSNYPNRSVESIEDDLSLSCSQSGKGEDITVDYTGINASLNHVATKTTSNAIIPLTRLVVALGIIEIFVPEEDVKNATDKGNDTYELKTKNRITSFDPDSISGQSNFKTEIESELDNKAFANLLYYGPGYTAGSYYKYFMKNIDEVVPLETTTYSWYSADGMVTPNRKFGARIQFTNSGNKDFNNSILCDVVDSNTYEVIDIEEGSAVKPYWNTSDMNYTVEYATGYVDSWPPPLNQSNRDLVINECKDSSVVWYDNTTDARENGGSITKIRLSIPHGVPAHTTAGLLLNLQVRGEDLSGTILPNNTNLVNYMAVQDTVLYGTDDSNWSGATRILNEYPTPASGGNYKADRAVLTRAIVRTLKSLSGSVFEPGDKVDVTIESTFTTDNELGEKDVVYITEMIDPGLNYVVGSANVGDPTIGSCDDLEEVDPLKSICTENHQVLIWNLGERVANEALPIITYTFSLSATVPSGTNHTYTVISSPADTSNVNIRKSNKNITISIPAELIISKEVNTPFREIDESPIEFTTFLRNGSTTDLTNLDIIDIIPFNGDGEDGFQYSVGSVVIDKKRVEPTSFHGTLEFIEASGDYSCANGVTWLYSNDNPTKMDISPVATINKSDGNATWCQGTETGPDSGCGFSNKDVTGIRLTGPSLDGDASCVFKVFFKPQGNKYGDIYTNTAGAFAEGVSLPVLSNDVSAIVPTIALGDYVWIDTNANGLQDTSEKGVGGITLELLDENDDLVKTTTSDDTGKYIFEDLTADTPYKIKAVVPSYYTFSPKSAGDDTTKDSDVDKDGVTESKKLNINQYYKHFDIGLTSSLKISGKVYTVGDNNGIENTEVKLYNDVNKDGKIDAKDKLIETITIPADGTYEFKNIFNGTYLVSVSDPNDAIPDGYVTAKESLSVLVDGESIYDKDFPYTVPPESDDKVNPSILGTLGAVDIEDLTGSDSDGTVVAFIIKSIPTSDSGILYYEDGVTEVKNGDRLTLDEAKRLKFDPKTDFSDVAIFTYASEDDSGAVDPTPARFTIPVHGLSNLGNTVWYDDNKDGIQDSTEFGVEGVLVTLYDSNDTVVKTTLTNKEGTYLFKGIKAGTYTVGFTDLPSGYKISPKNRVADDKDSDVDSSTGKSDEITLAMGTNDLTIDMGIYSDELSTLGDTVWYDDNKDGIQDDDELGVNGVKVTLYRGSDTVATTVTDARGAYIFRGLKNGIYSIGFSSLPSGYKISPKDTTDDDKDSDVDTSSGKTEDVNVTTASTNLDLDMGIYSNDPSIATLGDTVWYDDNKNGIQDSEELGVNGVKVTLYDKDSQVVKTTVTDSRGTYLFRNLIVGTYTVGFSSLPSGYKISDENATTEDKDSDVNPVTGKSDEVVVTKGSDNLDVDMGIYSDGFLVSTIGDTVWYDDDKDGIQDESELGANGVKVTLLDSDDKIMQTTVTDSRGTYLFRDVISGTYRVEFSSLPSGYKVSKQNQGTDDSKDSDIDPVTKRSGDIVVTSGSNDLDIDMGIYSDSTVISLLGNSVWYDDNKDGIQDDNEFGVSGVKVTLYDTDGAEIQNTVTDEKGTYIFRNLIADTYTVGFSNLPIGYKISPKGVGSSDKDSDVNSDGKTDAIELPERTNNLDIDMGIYTDKLSILGDTVWYDDNKDGIQDPTEKGVAGVKVTLYDSKNNVVQRVVTDTSGSYLFRSLVNDSYIVEFSNLPSSYKISPKNKGDVDTDSDVNSDGKTDVIEVTTSSINLNVDMGIYSDALSTLGNTVWYDDNKDGIQDAEEKGVEGVKVELLYGTTVVQSTVTNASGVYLFRNIHDGDYTVQFSNIPNAYKISPKNMSSEDKDSDTDSKGLTEEIHVPVGSNNLDVDMGIYSDALSTLGNTVWYDDNKDGIQDPEEKGAEGIKVELLLDSKVIKTTVTNSSGVYIFRDIPEGTYKVQFSNIPNSYKISPKGKGDDDKNSDADTTGLTDEIKVPIGSNNLDVDMGIYSDELSTLGDTVWYDDNKDGIQDETEKGVDGIKVTLYDSSEKVIQTTVTDKQGGYLFRDIPTGTYHIQFTNLPTAYKVSQQDIGTDDSRDSDVDKNGKTGDIVVLVGTNNLDVDMGIYTDKLSIIGDTVWYDDNKDGIQDETEKGVEGVRATLYDVDKNVVATTVTDREGGYLFREVENGKYLIEFTNLPPSYKISPKGESSEDKDSDVNPDATTDTIEATVGSVNLDIDMGIYSDELSTLGDTVWYDDNKDGIQDPIEKGVEGIKVVLVNSIDVIVQTTVTNREGTYIFRDIPDGTYHVAFKDLPANYKISPKDATSEDKDSDVTSSNGESDSFTLEVGTKKLDIDMGIYSDELSTLGDTVWYDDNKDGVQDGEESGVEGVKVELLLNKEVVQSTVTDKRGVYIFRDIPEGIYKVQFSDIPTSYKISPKDVGSTDRNSDTDLTGLTDDIKVPIGSNNLDIDMGIYTDKLATIGDTVWFDENKDGVQDETEKGAKGIKVTLYDSNNNVVQVAVTDKAGNYLFRDVLVGTYTIGFSDLPTTYKISPKDASSDEEDSDINPSTGKSDSFSVTVGLNKLDIDMGIYSDELSTIGDTVWYDTNKDGVQDTTESGVEGVRVILYDRDKKVVATTVTDREGSYLFREVKNGIYVIKFINLPPSYKISPKDASSDEKDSDVNSDGTTDNIEATVGSVNLDIDMGIYSDKLSTIGNAVWYDDDKDGIQDPEEFGAEGIKAVLLNSRDAVIQTTVTDRYGHYLFRDVLNGTYSVVFENLPNGYKVSPKDASSEDKDSDINPLTKKSDSFTVDVGTNNLDIDMGIYTDKLSIIGDSVWYDDNKDGIQDSEELGAEGIKVSLYSGTRVVQTAVTDRRGTYTFRDIREGTYSVGFSNLPNGYKASPKDITTDDLDSDVDVTTLKSGEILVTRSSTNLGVDMGIYSDKLSTIGDSVWYDDNKDGIQDETEFGAEGIKVTLFDSNNRIIQTAVTDRRGAYVFRDIREGTYSVGFSNLPNGYKVSPQDATSDEKDSDIDAITLKSVSFTVSRSSTNLNIDMGIYSDKLSVIGDSVWYDDNKDGIQDETEFGAEGIKVTLYAGTKIVQTTVTDRRGTYIFRDIIEGAYSVGFSNLPNGYKISPKNQGVSDKDSDVNSNGKTDILNITRSSHNLNVDMGIYSNKLSIIGDSVWYDDNRDGIQDETEFGAEGIDVTLYSGTRVVQTAVTDRRGTYIFRDIIEGDYTVGFSSLPNGYKISPKNRGTKDKDSDVNSDGKTDTITVTRSSHNLNVDMGIYSDKLSIVGDSVWYDDNRDGIQDETEFGVEGVRVVLYSDDKVVQTVVTDRRGTYIFRDILEGSYTVAVYNLPNGYKLSPKDTTADDRDSDIDSTTGRSDVITVTRSSHNLNVDIGIYSDKLAVLGDSVWYDDNKDGIQDEDEFGVEGVKVTLYSDKKIVQTVVTDRRGIYTFRDVLKGAYTLGFTDLPSGYKISPKNAEAEDKDSDVNVKTAKSDEVVVTEGLVNLDIDMGIYSNKMSTIGDTVWYDNNRDGIQDETETGVNGVKVNLYNENNQIVQTTVTGEHGVYIFRSVSVGTYYLGFSNLPNGYKISPKNAGAEDIDSDINPKTAKSDDIVVTVGSNNLKIDMGIYSDSLASIGNSVWYDDNRNGVQDSAEKGVKSVKVTLYTQAGSVVDMTTTDDSGAYHFYRLVPDSYYLVFSNIPVGYKITQKDVGNNEKDSDADLLTGQTVVTKLEVGENDLSWDMGIYNEKRATIGDTVWYDDNKNGLQDAYERGVDAVKITLYTDKNVEVESTLTDRKGNYKFVNLIPGKYYLQFSDLPISYEATLQNQGSDDNKDSDVDTKTLRTEATSLIAGQNDLSWDMGIYNNKGASIGDTVWYDDNANGIQDGYEKGTEDILVRLYTASGKKIDTTITDEQGNYSFRDLVPDSYYLEFDNLPVGYEISPQDVGDDNLDSDVNALTKKTDVMTLEIGQHAMNWDMGIFNRLKATLGDLVWYDTNHNGLQDIDEKGVNGIKVTLFNADNKVVGTRVTSKSGQYLFRDLVEGDYFVEFSEFPLGYMITKQNVSDNFLADSDANYHRSQTDLTSLEAGESDLSWDLGIYIPTLKDVTGRVWDDKNRDGIQESDEGGIADIKVTLVKNDVLQVASEQTTTSTRSVVTDANGSYVFENIEMGEPHRYHLIFDDTTLPQDYTFTEVDVGSDETLDSDVNPDTGETVDVVLGTGVSLTYDAGIQTLRVVNDSVVANTTGPTTVISVLENDGGNIDDETILLVDRVEGEALYSDGTAVAGASLNTSTTYVVDGEGTWQVADDGKITFTAENGFDGVPSPVYYIVQGVSGNQSNVAQIKITTPCTCKPYVEDDVATLNLGSIWFILIAISILGFIFARREFETKA